MSISLRLISAWNESGGGALHRLFDGHSRCLVAPYEIQLGTRTLHDGYEGWFSSKYRWPHFEFPLDSYTPESLFDAFIDQELKSCLTDPAGCKHRDFPTGIREEALRQAFCRQLPAYERTRALVVSAYLKALFEVWESRQGSGQEECILGHCPTLIVDLDLILTDFPDARIVHVVRSPVSGFADFRRRVPEMDLGSYCRKWSLVNALGFHYASRHPDRVLVVHHEMLLHRRKPTLETLCAFLGLPYEPILEQPTWNGRPLGGLFPFGGVPEYDAGHEEATRATLSPEARSAVLAGTLSVLSLFTQEIQELYCSHV